MKESRYSEFRSILSEDLNRLNKKEHVITSGKAKLLILFRLGAYLRGGGKILRIPYILTAILYRHYKYKLGVQLEFGCCIGGGFRICHWGGIVINGAAKIGKNFTIYQGVTVGSVYGPKGGVPTIGDNVVMFAGSTVIGNVHIGNNVMIGAGAVVTKDVPDNCIVAGVPAKVISDDSSETIGYYIR